MLLFHKLRATIFTILSWSNLRWFIVATAVSVIIVYSGFDWIYWITFRNTPLYWITFPAVIVGAFIPVFGLILYLLFGVLLKRRIWIRNAWALGQAALLGWLFSSFLKAFTGRIPPPRYFAQGLQDTSHGFQFGFLKHGIFWGWPSSHTAVAFSMAAALIVLYPHNKIIRTVALLYAFYIGIGVSMSIHWFSEFIAGAIIGYTIGTVVGKNFSHLKCT